MSDIEQALAEALHLYFREPSTEQLDADGMEAEAAKVLAATEPMQAIARIVDAAVEWNRVPIARLGPNAARVAANLQDALAALDPEEPNDE